MGSASLPPGFRFHPTDEELVGYYLKRKVEGLEIELEVIPVVDLCKFDPWELPEKSFLPKRDMEWFFFCARDRKYPNGSRTNRATKAGYWKATGKDRKVTCHSSVSGYRKTLVFYRGRAPLGTRTDWLMHEYRLGDIQTQNFQGSFALCRVVKKNEQAMKGNGHGELKPTNIGSSSNNENLALTTIPTNPDHSGMPSGSHTSFPSGHSSSIPYEINPISDFSSTDPTGFGFSSDLILDSSKDYSEIQDPRSGFFPEYEFSSSEMPWRSQEIEHSVNLCQFEGFNSCFNDDISLEAFDQVNSLSFPNQF